MTHLEPFTFGRAPGLEDEERVVNERLRWIAFLQPQDMQVPVGCQNEVLGACVARVGCVPLVGVEMVGWLACRRC